MNNRHAAIGTLYHDLGPALLAYARSLVHDAACAEDAVQQVFLKLLSGDDDLPREPRPYLFRAVRNTAFNRLRAATRETAYRSEPTMFVTHDGLEHLVPDLERALADLPDEQREVVMLRLWGELTIEGAAEVLGIPANTVASRYRYALAKLRQRFAGHVRSSHA
jgi:RNA polymerase sigma-70 factor (ECF subfamily)